MNGCVSTASAMIGLVKTLEPMVRAAKVLAAAFFKSRAGLFVALWVSRIRWHIPAEKINGKA